MFQISVPLCRVPDHPWLQGPQNDQVAALLLRGMDTFAACFANDGRKDSPWQERLPVLRRLCPYQREQARGVKAEPQAGSSPPPSPEPRASVIVCSRESRGPATAIVRGLKKLASVGDPSQGKVKGVHTQVYVPGCASQNCICSQNTDTKARVQLERNDEVTGHCAPEHRWPQRPDL